MLFLDRCEPHSTTVHWKHVGGSAGECDSSVPGACPMRSVVYRGNTRRWEPGCSGETMRNDGPRELAAASQIPWGTETDVVTNAALDLRGFTDHDRSETPTTGFHAVIAMALACRSVRLYGFAGDTSLDGHLMDAKHGIAREHALLRQLSDKTLPAAQMPTVLRGVWPATNVTIIC
jgi:hypothetical protein